jgi:hypothetical protein
LSGVIGNAGEPDLPSLAARRFLEFFVVNVRNRNTPRSHRPTRAAWLNGMWTT